MPLAGDEVQILVPHEKAGANPVWISSAMNTMPCLRQNSTSGRTFTGTMFTSPWIGSRALRHVLRADLGGDQVDGLGGGFRTAVVRPGRPWKG